MSTTTKDGDTGTAPASSQGPVAKEDLTVYPHGWKLYTILICLYFSVFLVALDRTIIATAIPTITDEFHSIDDIGWYASAFLLTGCAFMLFYGKIYTLYSIKWIFLTSITIFEIGSAICGAAPSSTALIVGRAIAGLGSAGIFSGAVIIGVHTVPLAKRPIFQGLFGAVFGVASVAGPLLGGAFTDKVSWRWCFYINLPIGAATIVALIFMLEIKSPARAKDMTYREQINQLDPLGTFFFLPGTVCLLLALKWGGTDYAWSDGRVVACLVLAGILIIAFILVQIWKGETATVPPRILKQRSVASGFYYATCAGGSMLVMVYYIPIWFQSVKGVSAVESGIRTIALVLSIVVSSISAGGITYKTGYYTPCMILSSVVISVGAGLITTFKVDSGRGVWIGYQVVYGFGVGLGMQQPNMAAQTVLSRKDVPIGSSLVFFGQSLGGAVFVSVAQNIFTNKLKDYLMHIQGIHVGVVMEAGATNIRRVVPPELLRPVLIAFNHALTKAFYVALAMACIGTVGALTMEWKSIKHGDGQGEKKQPVALEKDTAAV
ncbi:major facilitator superfamily transporter [Cenococcum geophilum 1.58]|uniref:major facilitator superfamily transporter n=1 Tax=Cenococcum geophilum 1.58 TaxID=794803 RepID=UPI003590127D|nr:major facilitator superfamily transporter [Cenococcum geophilum 1.58]